MKILVLDDTVGNENLFQRQAKELGHQLKQIYSLQKAKEIYQKFDLIICDIDLGNNETGFDFHDQVKDSFKGKFVFYSGDPYHEKEATNRDVPFIEKNGGSVIKRVVELIS